MRLLPQGETPSTGHLSLVVTDIADPKRPRHRGGLSPSKCELVAVTCRRWEA